MQQVHYLSYNYHMKARKCIEFFWKFIQQLKLYISYSNRHFFSLALQADILNKNL